jgi:hypothetical protein
VNPTAGDSNTPDAVALAGASISSFSTIGIRTTNLAPGDAVQFDNFQLSTTFFEAIGSPIPEPGSMLLGGAGCLLLVFGRRRLAAR